MAYIRLEDKSSSCHVSYQVPPNIVDGLSVHLPWVGGEMSKLVGWARYIFNLDAQQLFSMKFQIYFLQQELDNRKKVREVGDPASWMMYCDIAPTHNNAPTKNKNPKTNV
jgi:hypothetical protein